MGKVKIYDPLRMYNQGCAFCDIAKLCTKEPNVFEERQKSHFIGGLVNSLLACEIFMKTIIVVKDKNEKPKGHDLTKLWKQIKELDNDLTQNIEGQIKNLCNSKNDNLFNDILEVCKEQFKELRYIYEFDSIKCDANFIRFLRDILKTACKQML